MLADCRHGEVLAGKDKGDRGPSGKQFFMSQEAAGRIEVSSQQLACEQLLAGRYMRGGGEPVLCVTGGCMTHRGEQLACGEVLANKYT